MQQANSVFRAFLSNATTLGLALILAIIIWTTAVRDANPDQLANFQISTEIIERPAAIILSDPVSEVQISVEAPQQDLERIIELEAAGTKVFQAVIDLNGIPFGKQQVPISIQYDKEAWPQVDITLQVPEESAVQIDQEVSKDIPVVVEIRGSAARTHAVGSPVIDSPLINVTGPATLVNALSEARTTVNLDNSAESISVTKRPIFYNNQGNVVGINADLYTVSTREVQVTIPLEQKDDFADVAIGIDWTGRPSEDYQLIDISATPRSILVTGPRELIANLRRIQTEEIDLTGLKVSSTRRAQLILPDGIQLAEELQQVFIDVEIEPLTAPQLYNVVPEISGLDETLTATIGVEDVAVVLFGPREAIKTLNQEDVRVSLDVFGLVTGTHIITPTVDQPIQSIEVQSIQPEQVSVEIAVFEQESEIISNVAPISQTFVIISGTELITVTGYLSGTTIITNTNNISNTDAYVPLPTVTVDASEQKVARPAQARFIAAAPSHPIAFFKMGQRKT